MIVKKTFKGWIAKDSIKDVGWSHDSKDSELDIPIIFKFKGRKEDWIWFWPEEDWPPQKVRITIETVEK